MMAESWRRLSEKSAKNIQKHDILLLYHELIEIQYITQGYSQSDAHNFANNKYDYGTASRQYYNSLGFRF